MYLLYWGTQAYCTPQILLGAKHNMEFNIRLRELELWCPQISGSTLIVNTLQYEFVGISQRIDLARL
jgi:hypothetical protein